MVLVYMHTYIHTYIHMRKEAVVAYFKVLSQYLSEGTEENDENTHVGLTTSKSGPSNVQQLY
jgi:hypothetical protein